jgi:uracil-DNA glycosylase
MKRVLLIGQAPPQIDPEIPFARTKLYKWFSSIGLDYIPLKEGFHKHEQEGYFRKDGIDIAYVKFSSIITFFPGKSKGGDMAPTKEEILKDRPYLQNLIKVFNPDLIIPIGKLSIQECLSQESIKLENIIGNVFLTNPYNVFDSLIPVIPLPHPSGASTWIYVNNNANLVSLALEQIQNHINVQ